MTMTSQKTHQEIQLINKLNKQNLKHALEENDKPVDPLFPKYGRDPMKRDMVKFWKRSKDIDLFVSIISGYKKISLRLLDWFVTNYSKKHGVMYQFNDRHFIVHLEYKRQLDAYHKDKFDPFCRQSKNNKSNKVHFKYRHPDTDKVVSVTTTVGQLNFFKWAIEKKIIDYIEEHYQDIDWDINDYHAKRKSNKNTVYMSAKKTITKYTGSDNVAITVRFH